LISVDFKVGSFTIAAFTLVVIHESSTYSPVPSVFEVDAQPTTAVNMTAVNNAVIHFDLDLFRIMIYSPVNYLYAPDQGPMQMV